jgi:hypothetical protein
MRRVEVLRRSLLAAVIGAVGILPALAQVPDDPTSRARTVTKELNQAYKRWLSEDVAYIITKEERRAFNALQTDEERENFIENFWRRRDPNPDTEENEYR